MPRFEDVPDLSSALFARLDTAVLTPLRRTLKGMTEDHREVFEAAHARDGGQSLLTALARRLTEGLNHFRASELNTAALERLAIEHDLERAIADREFLLHFQPKIDARDRRIVGVEALIRWNHPERGMVSPGQFIPIAEETGLIVPLTEWVVEAACWQHAAWRRQGLQPLGIAVNLSGRNFKQANLVERIEESLRATDMEPEWLELELTESSLMEDVECAIQRLHALRELGVTLSLDDFGTGYSSLSYLKRFPIQTLKIDQSFVRGLPAERDDTAIVSVIIALAHQLGLATVAEGVEEDEQAACLLALGCHTMQGYRFYRPLAAEAVEALLRAERD